MKLSKAPQPPSSSGAFAEAPVAAPEGSASPSPDESVAVSPHDDTDVSETESSATHSSGDEDSQPKRRRLSLKSPFKEIGSPCKDYRRMLRVRKEVRAKMEKSVNPSVRLFRVEKK